MEKDNFKTEMIFRKDKNGVYAIMPYIIDGQFVTGYMHVGQHFSGDYYSMIQSSKLAKPEEYKDLFQELESLGYDIEVIKKRNYKKYLKAYNEPV